MTVGHAHIDPLLPSQDPGKRRAVLLPDTSVDGRFWLCPRRPQHLISGRQVFLYQPGCHHGVAEFLPYRSQPGPDGGDQPTDDHTDETYPN